MKEISREDLEKRVEVLEKKVAELEKEVQPLVEMFAVIGNRAIKASLPLETFQPASKNPRKR